MKMKKLNKNDIAFLRHYIVYEHWPDTREVITQTVELWNRWVRLSCYYNREHVSIVYTCNTYFI